MSSQKPALTSISIENFKGIGSRVTIPFKPLMLFFGPNNAGKSTVIEALLLANEVMNGRNPNVDKVELGGDLIRLGGFKSYVHGKDTNNVVKIRIEGSLGDNGLPTYERSPNMMMNFYTANAFDVPNPSGVSEYLECLKDHSINELVDIESVFIEFSLEFKGQWVGVRYCAGVNGEWILRTTGESSFFSLYPILEKQLANMTQEENSHFAIEFNSSHQALVKLSQKSEMDGRILNILDGEDCDERPGWKIKHDRYHGRDSSFDEPFCFETISPLFDNDKINDYFEDGIIYGDDLLFLSHITSQLLVGARKQLANVLSSHLFVGPFRSIPERGLEAIKQEDISWSDGTAAWAKILIPHLRESKLHEKAEKEFQAIEACAAAGEDRDGNQLSPDQLSPEINISSESESELNKSIAAWVVSMEWKYSEPEPDDYGKFLEAINSFLKVVGVQHLELEADPKYLYDASGPSQSMLQKIMDSQDGLLNVSKKDRDSIRAEIDHLDVNLGLRINNIETGNQLALRDVGSGVSQVVPVIAAILNPASLISIEQPELHLHPALQCGLGDTFLLGAACSKHFEERGVNVSRSILVETHSEHMLLRILRRIRETAEQNAPENLQITPDDLAVFTVEEEKDGTHIYEMEISEDGDLLTPWPNGFFPERMQEILGD